jgi:methyl-accepting chemotaxis protein
MGVMSILLVAITALGLAGMSKANDGLKTVYEDRLVPSMDLANVRQLMTENRLALASAQATRSPEFLARHAPRSARARSTSSIT